MPNPYGNPFTRKTNPGGGGFQFILPQVGPIAPDPTGGGDVSPDPMPGITPGLGQYLNPWESFQNPGMMPPSIQQLLGGSNYPLPSINWNAWRRYNQLQGRSVLSQRGRDVNENLARLGPGFNAPGWRQSLMNEPYQEMYRHLLGGEADINKAQLQAWAAQFGAQPIGLNMSTSDPLGDFMQALAAIAAAIV